MVLLSGADDQRSLPSSAPGQREKEQPLSLPSKGAARLELGQLSKSVASADTDFPCAVFRTLSQVSFRTQRCWNPLVLVTKEG